MIKKTVITSVIIVFTLCFSSFAQFVSLDQCISLGTERNPSLRRTALEMNLNQPAVRAAWGQFLPSVSVGYGINQYNSRINTYIADDGRVIELPITLPDGEVIPIEDRKSRNSSYYLNVEEVIFNGGRDYLNLKNAKLTKEISKHNLRTESIALRAKITQVYCMTVAAQQRQELAREVLQQRLRQIDLAQARFETGTVTRRDVMQAEVDLGRARNDSLSADLRLRRSIENLNLLIGFPVDSVYNLSDLPSLFIPKWDMNSLAAEALNKRGDLAASALTIYINKNDYLVSKSNYLPRLTGSYSYSRSEQSGTNVAFTLNPRNRSSSAYLTLSWQVFDRFSRSLRIQEAKIRHQKAQISREELKREVQREVYSAIDELKSIYYQNQVAHKNTELAAETYRFEEERYRLGSATKIELGNAHISFISARDDEIRLNTEFYIALGELEQATGMTLRENN